MQLRASIPVLLLVLGLAAPAMAAADLTRVTIDVETLRVSGALASLKARVEVEGGQIVRATLTPPGGMAVALTLTGESFVLEQTFASEQALATALPDGDYLLTLNGSTAIVLEYLRTPVPSPAISAPLPASVLVPGPVTVAFTRCLACVEDAGATTAWIFDDEIDEVIVIETLLPRDASWTPSDAAGDPIELHEDGSFAAVVLHSALTDEELITPGGDAFEFLTGVFHGDAVPFFTGSAPPAGKFCVVVGDDSVDACLEIDQPEAALVDPSGDFALPIAGVEIEYSAELLPSGEIVGSADADLDGNGSLETTTPLRGKLTGFGGKLDRSIAFDFRSLTPAAKLAVRIHDRTSVSDGGGDGSQRAKGTVLGARVKEDAPSTLPAGVEPLGWRLDVELAGTSRTPASRSRTGARSRCAAVSCSTS